MGKIKMVTDDAFSSQVKLTENYKNVVDKFKTGFIDTFVEAGIIFDYKNDSNDNEKEGPYIVRKAKELTKYLKNKGLISNDLGKKISDLESQLEKIFNSEISEISYKILGEKISENSLNSEKKSEILKGSVEKFCESQEKISELDKKISELEKLKGSLLDYNENITDEDRKLISKLEKEKKSLEEGLLNIYNFLFKKNIPEYSKNFSDEILKEIINLVKNNISFSKELIRQNKEIENYQKIKWTLISVVNNLNLQNAKLEFGNSTLKGLLDETVLELDKVFDENKELQNEIGVTRGKLIQVSLSAKKSEFIINQQLEFIKTKLQQNNSLELEKGNLENEIQEGEVNLEEVKSKFRKENGDLIQKNKNLEGNVSELFGKIFELREENINLENEKNLAEDQADEAYDLLLTAVNKNENLENEILKIYKNLESEKLKNLTIERRIEFLDNFSKKLGKKLSIQRKLNKLDEESFNKILKEIKNKNKSKILELRKEIKRLEKESQEKEDENFELKDKISGFEEEISNLSESISNETVIIRKTVNNTIKNSRNVFGEISELLKI